MYLPLEIENYILYKMGGLEHKTAKIIKEFVKENDLYLTEQMREPNLYEFLKGCKILKPILPYFTIYDEDFDVYYAIGSDGEYISDSDLEVDYSSDHSNDLELD